MRSRCSQNVPGLLVATAVVPWTLPQSSVDTGSSDRTRRLDAELGPIGMEDRKLPMTKTT